VIDLTLETPPVGPDRAIRVYGPRGAPLDVNEPLDLMRLRLDVIDDRGDPLDWSYNRLPANGRSGRMTITAHGPGGSRVDPESLRLRFWGVVGAATEVPFSFRDIPTP
jgi:hypothetical protein